MTDSSDYYNFPEVEEPTYGTFQEYLADIRKTNENEYYGAMVQRRNCERYAAGNSPANATAISETCNTTELSTNAGGFVKGNLFRAQQQQLKSPPIQHTYLHSPLSPQYNFMRSSMSTSTSPFSVESMLSPSSASLSPPQLPNSNQHTDFCVTSPISRSSSTVTKATAGTDFATDTNSPTAINTSPKSPKKRKRKFEKPMSPRLSQSTMSAKRLNPKSRLRWSDDETTILVEIYKKWARKLRYDKKASTWELIKKQYDLRCKQEQISTKRTVKQIQDKINYLVTTYKEIKDNNGLTGRGKKTFKWYDQMSDILDHRSAVVPTNLSEVMPEKKKPKKKKHFATTSSTTTVVFPESTSTADPDPESTTANVQAADLGPLDLLLDGEESIPGTGTSAVHVQSQHYNSSITADEDSEENPDSDDDSDQPTTEAVEDGNASTKTKRMSKQAAFSELVTTMKAAISEQTKEVKRQNKLFREAAEKDRQILQQLADGYKADSEANVILAAALADFIKK